MTTDGCERVPQGEMVESPDGGRAVDLPRWDIRSSEHLINEDCLMRHAYITAVGSYLPGEPIDTADIEQRLGQVGEKSSVLKDKICKANGIKQRHYAIDADGKTTQLNEELAAAAVLDALRRRGREVSDVTMLAAATTQGDLPVPGFASMVHGRLGGGTMETMSLGGVCCSGMAALVSAVRAVQSGAHSMAVAVASEQVSRSLKASRFAWTEGLPASKRFDAEFLRWMLSDGAGAVVVESQPRPYGMSLRVDWTHLASHAHRNEACMYSGMIEPTGNEAGMTWLDQPSIADADDNAMMAIRQDVRRIPAVLRAGAEEWVRLAHNGLLDPLKTDLVLCHFSSEHFRSDVFKLMYETGLVVPEEKWFTNLESKGNTGSASIFIMLEEAFNQSMIKAGQRVVMLVPESGRFSVALAQLTAVSETAASIDVTDAANVDDPLAALAQTDDAVLRKLLADLALVWADFERHLGAVPLVRRIESDTATIDDYQRLLVNLRQQVMEGARWISRAASNLTIEYFPLRSTFIGHAAEEHRDFQLLERNYEATGGDVNVILNAEKNVGSEALSAYIFNQASQPNPLDLLGAMFVIEGLGTRKADSWAQMLKSQLGLSDDQLTFFLYHGANDDDHFEKLRNALSSGVITAEIAARIVKTARVTARLYALQLEELDNV